MGKPVSECHSVEVDYCLFVGDREETRCAGVVMGSAFAFRKCLGVCVCVDGGGTVLWKEGDAAMRKTHRPSDKERQLPRCSV